MIDHNLDYAAECSIYSYSKWGGGVGRQKQLAGLRCAWRYVTVQLSNFRMEKPEA